MAIASNSRINNGSRENGPFGLNVPSLPLDLVKALPEVGVDRGFLQMFPADPHDTFGSAKSVHLPLLPADPTHHQVVIS